MRNLKEITLFSIPRREFESLWERWYPKRSEGFPHSNPARISQYPTWDSFEESITNLSNICLGHTQVSIYQDSLWKRYTPLDSLPVLKRYPGSGDRIEFRLDPPSRDTGYPTMIRLRRLRDHKIYPYDMAINRFDLDKFNWIGEFPSQFGSIRGLIPPPSIAKKSAGFINQNPLVV